MPEALWVNTCPQKFHWKMFPLSDVHHLKWLLKKKPQETYLNEKIIFKSKEFWTQFASSAVKIASVFPQ